MWTICLLKYVKKIKVVLEQVGEFVELGKLIF